MGIVCHGQEADGGPAKADRVRCSDPNRSNGERGRLVILLSPAASFSTPMELDREREERDRERHAQQR
jgi:hypothetical protein